MTRNQTKPAPSARSQIKQSAKKAHYDQQSVYRVIDDAVIGTVAIIDNNAPIAIPMAIARIGDKLYLHGSRSSRLMKSIASGSQVCINITHLDGIVVARSGMHCSANYRSVVIHGQGEEITHPEEHARLLYEITYQIIPGSEGDYRPHLKKELKATTLIAIPLSESACKIRTGDPIDDPEDLNLPYWAGVIPVTQVYGEPIPSKDLSQEIETPDYALHYQRPKQPHE
ncbi:MAG: pyridoxamine 5'-phosphate oxidase family protein [Arenicella sp.]